MPKGLPQQRQFRHALAVGTLVIRDPAGLIPTLSKGERAVVSLALELSAPVLLDDFRANQHANQQYGARAISLAQCLILFWHQGILNVPEAEIIFVQLKQTRATNSAPLMWAAQKIHKQGGRLLWQ
ncbi:MAG: hypothetical protein M0Z36_04215 [Thermaerobacter sp.]|nr:hypothetical protein [Thermaerobacter sp.]